MQTSSKNNEKFKQIIGNSAPRERLVTMPYDNRLKKFQPENLIVSDRLKEIDTSRDPEYIIIND
jgi:hypothetical protein